MSPDAHAMAAITIDLDTTRFYRAIHGLPDLPRPHADVAYEVGLRRFLQVCHDHTLKATLFVIGSDTGHPTHTALLANAHAQGHELANHTYHHRYDLRRHAPGVIAQDIDRGEDAIAAITGQKPVGFRTPGYNIDPVIFAQLASRPHYLYDSSLFPCPPYWAAKACVMAWLALRGKPSRSMMTRAATLRAPITPYIPHREAPWGVSRETPQGASLWEVPMALVPGVRLPVIGTSLHLFGKQGFQAVWPLLSHTYRRLFHLEFHALDFVDAQDEGVADLVAHQPDLRIPWRQKRALYDHVFDTVGRGRTYDTLAGAVRSFV